MSSDSTRYILTCENCGGEYIGTSRSHICPECRTLRVTAGLREKKKAPKDSPWRHMFRDETGTVIRPGGNVMKALDELCAYEEICEAAGIEGPEGLRKMLEGDGPPASAGMTEENRTPKARRKEEPGQRVRIKEGRFCEQCGHFQPTAASGGHGICKKHKRKIRPEGGKGSEYEELDEPRPVAARRQACRDWTLRNKRQWIGPSAELMPEEVT